MINFRTVKLEGASPRLYRLRNSNSDDIPDVFISFSSDSIKFSDDHTEATLTGKTVDGIMFMSPFVSARTIREVPSDSFDTAINGYILSQALKSVGQRGGICKPWVRQCVQDASGRLLSDDSSLWYWPERTLPSNQQSSDRWYNCDWTIIVDSGADGLAEDWRRMNPGQIVQLNGTTVSSHTMIIEEATESGLWVIDSNWDWDGIVQRHFIDKSWLDDYSRDWTLYQIR